MDSAHSKLGSAIVVAATIARAPISRWRCAAVARSIARWAATAALLAMVLEPAYSFAQPSFDRRHFDDISVGMKKQEVFDAICRGDASHDLSGGTFYSGALLPDRTTVNWGTADRCGDALAVQHKKWWRFDYTAKNPCKKPDYSVQIIFKFRGEILREVSLACITSM